MIPTAPTKSALEVDIAAAELFKPPRRTRPSVAAEKALRTEKGAWDPDLVPYMIEPIDCLGGREYRGVVFVGPARTGKTMALILGGVTYIVTCAPGDMLIIQMSQDAARDFSRMDLDRAIRNSPELAQRMSPRPRDDNTFDKFFRSGVVLKLGWPAVSQLSSKTLQYVFVTDYDRPDNVENVDGEGPLWDLVQKRTETYMSRGKCLAESSPGKSYDDASWVAKSPHEAPPATGILSIYNSGTRARWYWPCQHCGEHFQAKPGVSPFTGLPGFDELCEIVVTHDLMSLSEDFAKVGCPHCGGLHEPQQRRAMNAARVDGDRIFGATWLHDGESIVDGRLEGGRRRSSIASFWLGGVAAAYQPWTSIVYKYLGAVQTYVRTGDEGPLKTTTNTDQGAPYIPIAAQRRRTPEDFVARLEEWPRGAVPDGVRFLTAAVDVQAHRFVVTVMGWGIGLESWIVERFSITASNRPEGNRTAAIDPASYVEDWEVLVGQVVDRSYKLQSNDEIELKPVLVFCDSGGREGVTDKAYEFWRAIKRRGLGQRFRLVKGVGNLNAPRVVEAYPDARARKDRRAGRGDVPVWMLNVNVIKDGVFGDLSREVPGPGYVHLPVWLDPEFFSEITAENRTAKGWEREKNAPNEAFDLHVYNRAVCIVLRAEVIDWSNPPSWALEPHERSTRKRKSKSNGNTSAKRNWTSQW